MALRSGRKARFLKQNPFCYFCGGGGAASGEFDHLPSRASFDNRHFPDGFEFPACGPCNESTKDDEQVVALLSRADSNLEAATIPDEIGRYMQGVANNNPEVFTAMVGEHGRLDENHGVFGLNDATDQAFIHVLTRWAKAFHYRETGFIVSACAPHPHQYFTNANAMYIPAAYLLAERNRSIHPRPMKLKAALRYIDPDNDNLFHGCLFPQVVDHTITLAHRDAVGRRPPLHQYCTPNHRHERAQTTQLDNTARNLL